MAEQRYWVRHIESFVDSSSSPAQQTVSVDAVVSLVKNGSLTVEALVREMEMYLTITDHTIRAKGILLLGEVLACLASKPLDSTTLHSLIGFFTERLEDWKALCGALVGCLALLRRNSKAGMVLSSDAKVVAQSFLRNQQVQVLGQHDRKLCFELLECLLDRYADAVAVLGDDLVHGICAAIDGEKDPQCLVHTFHIVELLAQLFPDPSASVAGFAGELFEILGSYFPIHFTHSGGEDIDVKRDDLSKALMLAFSSTPLFEPFVIPLLLEKLSSSLLAAKVDSLKYLSSCTLMYGGDRMAKHSSAIWHSIKEAINTSMVDPDLSNHLEPDEDMSFQDNEIVTEALTLLKNNITQNPCVFLKLIISDEDISTFINSVVGSRFFSDIPSQSKLKLYAIGHILSVSSKASISSCSGLFQHFFPHLMAILGYSVKCSYEDAIPGDKCILPEKVNMAVLYLCVELLSACRDLLLNSDHLTSKSDSECEALCIMLHSYLKMLSEAFSFCLAPSANDDTVHFVDFYVGVRGLQTLATFPGGFLTLSKVSFENMLLKLMSVVTTDFKMMFRWKLALKALVRIGSYVESYNEPERALSFMSMVVEKFVSLISVDDFSDLFSYKLEALYEVGTSGLKCFLRVVEGLEEAVSTNLSAVYVYGNSMRAPIAIQLLECFSSKVFPWLHKIGSFDEISLHFACDIWNQIENSQLSIVSVHEKALLEATMIAMKLAVGNCSVETQCSIVERAYDAISSSILWFKESIPTTSAAGWLRKIQSAQSFYGFSCRDERTVSLFGSVIIALRPQVNINNLREILNLFTSAFLIGHVPAAQALGSILNKLPSRINGAEVQCDLFLEEALDIIFDRCLWNFNDESGNATSCCSTLNNRPFQIHAVVGLGWMGKGLLMRGHERVKDITMILLRCLLSNVNDGALPLRQDMLDGDITQGLISSLRKYAADAFHIMMIDSDACLIQKFHANVRPLYKQRFFTNLLPVLLSAIVKSDSPAIRLALYRACGYVISETPITVIFSDANKILPVLVHGLSSLVEDITDKDLIYSLLLVLSGLLTDKNGQEVVTENAHMIINCLTRLVSYPHMMLVRETALQCLTALSALPHSKTYSMRTQVVQSISKAFDDPKRRVRQEAVRCQRAWLSIASASYNF